MNKIIFSIFFLFVFSAGIAQAQQMTTPPETPNAESSGIQLNVPIGTQTRVNNFSEYVRLWYNFVLGTVGIVAAVMIMWGGFKWLTSRGEAEAVKDAKERIVAAITGLVLAFLSYTILFLINPNLVNLTMPELTKADFSSLGLDADEGKPAAVLRTSGTSSAKIEDLNQNAQKLHSVLLENSKCNLTVTSTRRAGTGTSEHYSGNAIDYARDGGGCVDNYFMSLCNAGKPNGGTYNGQQIYTVTFPNGQRGRIINEDSEENNCWHVDLRPWKNQGET